MGGWLGNGRSENAADKTLFLAYSNLSSQIYDSLGQERSHFIYITQLALGHKYRSGIGQGAGGFYAGAS